MHGALVLIFSDPITQLKTFDGLICDLQSAVTVNNPSIYPFLTRINSLLSNALSTCKAAETMPISKSFQKQPDNIPPGKKMALQWRFKATSKTPGRKKKGKVLR